MALLVRKNISTLLNYSSPLFYRVVCPAPALLIMISCRLPARPPHCKANDEAEDETSCCQPAQCPVAKDPLIHRLQEARGHLLLHAIQVGINRSSKVGLFYCLSIIHSFYLFVVVVENEEK
jgi:hypothetical protein